MGHKERAVVWSDRLVTPYFQDEYVTLYHGDCREVLPGLACVDLVLTDPPYGIAARRMAQSVLVL